MKFAEIFIRKLESFPGRIKSNGSGKGSTGKLKDQYNSKTRENYINDLKRKVNKPKLDSSYESNHSKKRKAIIKKLSNS